MLAARDGDRARAGRLVGAARAARARAVPDPVEQRLEATATATAGGSPDEWEQAVAGGLALGWEQSIALGLSVAVSGTQAR